MAYQDTSAEFRAELMAAGARGVTIAFSPIALLEIVNAFDALVEAHRDLERQLRAAQVERDLAVALPPKAFRRTA
jgi:hypothetical protein